LISEFVLSYSWWWLVIVVLAGLAYALLLYYKNPVSKLSKRVSASLFVLRFLSVAILTFLLFSPFIKTRVKTKEKPIVVVGVDNSQSLVLSADTLFYRETFPAKVTALVDQLRTDYKTDFFVFGSKIRMDHPIDYSDNQSDYSSFINMVKENYRGLNVGAVILAGDGLYNIGANPVYSASELKWPVYTIALGDTTTYSDMKINDVRFNRLVYLNDHFPVEVNVDAVKLKGKKAVLKLFAFGKLVDKKSFDINSNHFAKTFRMSVLATEKGKHRVKMVLTVFDNELNKQNNSKSIFVNVLDTRQKVLVVAAAPHPDIAAIKHSLEGFRDYQVDVQYVKKLTAKPEDYDLIVYYQLPSLKKDPVSFMKRAFAKKIPSLFVLGNSSNIKRFNSYFDGLNIYSPHGVELAQPIINTGFSLFTYDEQLAGELEKFPPLTVPFGNYKPADRARVLAYQKINGLDTDIPLVLYYENDGVKSAVIAGEGLWLWKMHDYLQNSNSDAVETLLGKSVQYLTAREDRRPFRIISRENFQPGDKVILRAELYNDARELVNDADINLTVTNEDGEQFKYSFSPYEDFYRVSLLNLSPGVYRYRGVVNEANKTYTDKGEFVVNSVSIESRKLQADFNLMYRMATESAGAMIYPVEMDSLPKILKNNQSFKTKIVYNYRTRGLNDIWYILFVILFLLSLEWFLRKYFGSY